MIAQKAVLFNTLNLAVFETEDALVSRAAELQGQVALGEDEAAVNQSVEFV